MASPSNGSMAVLARTQASSVVNDSMSPLRSPLGGAGSSGVSIPASSLSRSNSRSIWEAGRRAGGSGSGRGGAERSQAVVIMGGKTMTDPATRILRAERVRSIEGMRRRRPMDDKNRSKALELAIAGVEKEFGKGAIMRLKDGESLHEEIPVVPTGSVGLDLALRIRGYPRGRIVEIYGPESSGKTTLTLHAIANVQKQGAVAAFIAAEHALDPPYPKNPPVKTQQLLLSQPDYAD